MTGLVGMAVAAVLALPAPRAAAATPASIYDRGGIPAVVPAKESDADPAGVLSTYQPGGPTVTAGHAFFQPLGTNGRACVTCHQPPSGMSVSVANIRARYTATGGRDPIFAPVDGATCPANATAIGRPASAYALLLNQGVFRIVLPVPANAEFTVTVVSDPYGCNTDPRYNRSTDPVTGATTRLISVYRRPLMAANLPFIVHTLPIPSATKAAPPALMWDERESSLAQQSIDATLGHAQALVAPSTAQIAQIVRFESGIYSAQDYDTEAHSLAAGGATGGAVALAAVPVGQAPRFTTVFQQFSAWTGLSGGPVAARRGSIARGQAIFNTRLFTVANVEGINTPLRDACSSCHHQEGVGNDPHGTVGRLDIGVGGGSPQFGGPTPSRTLPIFRVTCTAPRSTRYHGATVVTNDPGNALATGKCGDLLRFQTPPIRALAARAPYFHDGSAATLRDVVDFYNTRFAIGLSSRDTQDLVNFLGAL